MKITIQAFNPNYYTHNCIIAHSKMHCCRVLSDLSAELISQIFFCSCKKQKTQTGNK